MLRCDSIIFSHDSKIFQWQVEYQFRKWEQQRKLDQCSPCCLNKPLLIFLQNNPEVVNYSKELLDKYGAGLSSVRFICGTQSIHKQLEKKIAQFHGREDAILYASCFDANAGIFEAILTPDDAVFSDELNHASIIDGIRLCKAQKQRYKHRDMSGKNQPLHSTCVKILHEYFPFPFSYKYRS